jgi:hypothetical protein
LPGPELVGTGTISVAAGRSVNDVSKVPNVPYAGGDVLKWAQSS